MRVMLLAAGKGERMRPLTLEHPKPLLEVAGKPLIAYHLERLATAGITDVVINVAWLAQQIMDFCASGEPWGLRIHYSEEPEPLETAGGIVQALPLLGDEPFAVINADVWTDFPVASLRKLALNPGSAHLIMVANPEQHPQGDFVLRGGQLGTGTGDRLTFSGIGLYHPAFFAGCEVAKRPLLPLFLKAIAAHRLFGEQYAGVWADVGTPERLATLNLQQQTLLANTAELS